jgi:WD40 repeat protein
MNFDKLEDNNSDLDKTILSLNDPTRSIRQAAFHKLSKLDDDAAKQALWNYRPFDRMECLHTITDFNITDYNGCHEDPEQLPQYFRIADYSNKLVCYWSLTYKRAHLCYWDLATGQRQTAHKMSTHEFGLGQRGKIAIHTYQDGFSLENLEDITDRTKPSHSLDGLFTPQAFAVYPMDKTLLAIGRANSGRGGGEIKIIDYQTNTYYLKYEFEKYSFYNSTISPSITNQIGGVEPFLFSPDGQILLAHFCMYRLVSMLQVWNVETRELIKIIESIPSIFVTALAVRPDGTILACGLRENKICAWELLTDRIIFTISDSDPMPSTLSPDGRIMMYGTSSGDLVIWDLEIDREVCKLTGHTEPIRFITISEDREFVATYSENHSIKIWGIPELIKE